MRRLHRTAGNFRFPELLNPLWGLKFGSTHLSRIPPLQAAVSFPKRRSPVRFFLSVVLVSGLISSAFAQPANKTPTEDEKKAIDLVVKAGGKAEIDTTLPDSARVSAKFESITDAGLANLKKAPQIGALDVFDATRCTDKGFVTLKELPHLRRLILGKSEMTPAHVKAIGQCVELRRLYLAGSGLSDTELASLKSLTHLMWLDISDNPQITDRGMATVKSLE